VLCSRDWGIIDEDAGEDLDSDNEEGDIIEERRRQQGDSIVAWDWPELEAEYLGICVKYLDRYSNLMRVR
jgi:hypothetical protein